MQACDPTTRSHRWQVRSTLLDLRNSLLQTSFVLAREMRARHNRTGSARRCKRERELRSCKNGRPLQSCFNHLIFQLASQRVGEDFFESLDPSEVPKWYMISQLGLASNKCIATSIPTSNKKLLVTRAGITTRLPPSSQKPCQAPSCSTRVVSHV